MSRRAPRGRRPRLGWIGRSRARVLAASAAVALTAALCCSSAEAAPVGAVEHFPTKCSVAKLVAGPDGNVWFTCFRLGTHLGAAQKSIVGRITPQGAVTEFSAGIPAGSSINELVVGPDGNLWFTLVAGLGGSGRGSRVQSAIGRITPEGNVTLFSAGLRKKSYPDEIIAGSDGNLWFLDGTIISTAADTRIGRVTPQGSITEFPTGLPQSLDIGGLAAGPDGNLWFTQVGRPQNANEPGGLVGRMDSEGTVTSFGSPTGASGAPIAGPDGNLWFVEWPGGPVSMVRVTPGGEITRFGRGQVGLPTHLVTGPDGNIWFTAQQSVGRVTPSGEVSRFTDCMDFRQDFSEATQIVSGPGGDLWFSTITSRTTQSRGERESPTIGRVTPSGEITLFKDGVENQSSLIAGPDGNVWFAGDGEEIERITPPSAPVNTFVFAPGNAKANGAAEVPVEVPGLGRIELHQLALLLPGKKTRQLQGTTVSAVAQACGPTRLKFRLAGAAAAVLHREGRVRIKVSATFTPTGGSANTEIQTITLSR
jgi:streptogramin lyase